MTRRWHTEERSAAITGSAHLWVALGILTAALTSIGMAPVGTHSRLRRSHAAIPVVSPARPPDAPVSSRLRPITPPIVRSIKPTATRSPAALTLGTVDFVDARNGWAAGDAILSTTDGGRTWRRQVNPVGPIGLLDFVNRDDGWALGDTTRGQATGTIIRTTDGGRHWHVVPEPRIGGRPYTLTRVRFASRAFGAGVAAPGPNAYDGSPGSRGRALLTVDGGHTWQALPTPTDVSSLCFVDRTTGWAIEAGHGILLRTTDGGHTWRQSLPDSANGATFFFMGGDLACASASTVWALLYGDAGMAQQTYALYHTTDAGTQWRAVVGRMSIGGDPPPGTPGIPVKALHRHDDAPGAYGGPLASIDGTTAYLGGNTAATHTISIGGTSDGGRTWRNRPAIVGLRSSAIDGFPGFALSFVSARRGWLVANVPSRARSIDGPRPMGVILSTRDGGRTWQQQYPVLSPTVNG